MYASSRSESATRHVGEQLRSLREARALTQTELSAVLGMSQARLSQVERGRASLTAEQLLTVLSVLNVSVAHFSRGSARDPEAELQNALIRHGARHLAQSVDVLVGPELDDLVVVVRRTLLSRSPRLLTSLAPVLVDHVDDIDFVALWAAVATSGLGRRLQWVVQNVLVALEAERGAVTSTRRRRAYARAALQLSEFLARTERQSPRASMDEPASDLLDASTRSPATLRRLRDEASEPSRARGIVTAIQPEDFRRALRDAHASD